MVWQVKCRSLTLVSSFFYCGRTGYFRRDDCCWRHFKFFFLLCSLSSFFWSDYVWVQQSSVNRRRGTRLKPVLLYLTTWPFRAVCRMIHGGDWPIHQTFELYGLCWTERHSILVVPTVPMLQLSLDWVRCVCNTHSDMCPAVFSQAFASWRKSHTMLSPNLTILSPNIKHSKIGRSHHFSQAEYDTMLVSWFGCTM